VAEGRGLRRGRGGRFRRVEKEKSWLFQALYRIFVNARPAGYAAGKRIEGGGLRREAEGYSRVRLSLILNGRTQVPRKVRPTGGRFRWRGSKRISRWGHVDELIK